MLKVLLVAPNVVGEIYFAHQRGKAMVGHLSHKRVMVGIPETYFLFFRGFIRSSSA